MELRGYEFGNQSEYKYEYGEEDEDYSYIFDLIKIEVEEKNNLYITYEISNEIRKFY